MRNRLATAVKDALRPIAQHRQLIERAKYLGTAIADGQTGNDIIHDALVQRRPIAAGKMGETELGGLQRHLRLRQGSSAGWGHHAEKLFTNAGVYPAYPEVFARFCEEYARALGSLDILGVWFRFGENRIRKMFAPRAVPVAVRALEPYYHERPWSAALAGKKVLVITPFADTVRLQYARRVQIWAGKPGVLPQMQLDTLRCPLSAGITEPHFADWFAALDAMRAEMSRRDFEVTVVGAGAWGLPLVAHARRLGRTGIHLGGATQLLFGIRGARWDGKPVFQSFFNDAWVRPSSSDRPDKFRNIENGCYW